MPYTTDSTVSTDNTDEVLLCANCGDVLNDDPMTTGSAIIIGEDAFCDLNCAEQYGYHECQYCGNWVHEDEAVSTNGGDFCSADCAHAEGWYECAECGEWVDSADAIVIGDEYFCNDDCAERAGYYRCERCDGFVHEDDAVYIEGKYYCSEECANRDGYYVCERCGEWEHEDFGHDVCGEYWCNSCTDYHASYCEECEQYVHDYEIHYDESRDEYICDDCAERLERENRTELLHRYGWTPQLRFFGDGTLFLGVELETDGGSNRRAYLEELAGIDGFQEHFWCTEDSSLDNGVEITGHPMTLGHHLEIMGIYEGIRNAAVENEFVSHNGGRCGLHVHVNRDWFGKSRIAKDVGGYKMMRLLQRFRPQFMTFSRRDSDRWCRYQTGNDSYFKPKGTVVSAKTHPEKEASLFSKANAMSYETSHSQALNFQHGATFEFRIFRGTLKWSTYFASLAMVNGMCHLAKERGSEYVENVDWYTFANDVVAACDEPRAAEYLADYLKEKELV